MTNLISGDDLRYLIPLLGSNNYYPFDTLYHIFTEDKKRYQGSEKRSLTVYNQSEFENKLKDKRFKKNETDHYYINIFDAYKHDDKKISLYTNLNLDDTSNVRTIISNNEDAKNLKDILLEILSRNMIMINFEDRVISDDLLDAYSFTSPEIFINAKNNIDKSYKLLYFFIKNVFGVNDKVLIDLVYYSFVKNLLISSVSNKDYLSIEKNTLQNVFQYSKLISQFIKNIFTSNDYYFIESEDKEEDTYYTMGERDKINEIFFSSSPANVVEEILSKLNINLPPDTEDEINILQTYRYWNQGEKDEYLSGLKCLEDDSINKLIGRLNLYSGEKVKKILYNKQKELEMLRK